VSDETKTATGAADQPAPPEFRTDWERVTGVKSPTRDAEYRDFRDAQRAEVGLSDWHDSGEENANVRLINNRLNRMPPEERAAYESGVTADGTRLLNDPATLRKLAAEARQSPAVLTEAAKKHNGNERAAIESLMADRNSIYWKSADSENLQARYRDLIRESEVVHDTIAASPKEDLDRLWAFVREHANETGFERTFVSEFVAKGLSVNEAHAAALFFMEKL
jgi:hypothetical protein